MPGNVAARCHTATRSLLALSGESDHSPLTQRAALAVGSVEDSRPPAGRARILRRCHCRGRRLERRGAKLERSTILAAPPGQPDTSFTRRP